MTTRSINTCEVAATIMKADPAVSEDQALEIADQLDGHDSWYGGRDGQVEVVAHGWQEQERICRVVSDIIDTPNKAAIQSSLMTLLLDRSSEAVPDIASTDASAPSEPELQQASSLNIGIIQSELIKISQSPLIDPKLRAEIQDIIQLIDPHVNRQPITECVMEDPSVYRLYRTNPYFKVLLGEIVNIRDWIGGFLDRIKGGILTQDDLTTLKGSFGTLKSYAQIITKAKAEEASVSQVLPKVVQVGTSVRAAGISVSQAGAPASNPLLRGIAIGLGVALVVVGATLGIAYYLGRDESVKK